MGHCPVPNISHVLANRPPNRPIFFVIAGLMVIEKTVGKEGGNRELRFPLIEHSYLHDFSIVRKILAFFYKRFAI